MMTMTATMGRKRYIFLEAVKKLTFQHDMDLVAEVGSELDKLGDVQNMANEMQMADANGLDSLDLNVDMIETVSP